MTVERCIPASCVERDMWCCRRKRKAVELHGITTTFVCVKKYYLLLLIVLYCILFVCVCVAFLTGLTRLDVEIVHPPRH